MHKPMYKVMFVVAIGVAACGKGSPGNSSASGKETPARPEKLDQLAAELAAIAGESPAPTPTLPDGVAVTVQNTLVVTDADLALQRKQPREPSVRVPERTPLVEMLAQARGGALQDKGIITDAARDTALRSIDELKYIAVVEERAWIDSISRNRVALWDRGAKAWVGALWVSVGLTDRRNVLMARYRNGEKVGPAFTVGETPEECVARHRREMRSVLDKALTERAQQWVADTEVKEEVKPFVPDHVRTYKFAGPQRQPGARPRRREGDRPDLLATRQPRDRAPDRSPGAGLWGSRARRVARLSALVPEGQRALRGGRARGPRRHGRARVLGVSGAVCGCAHVQPRRHASGGHRQGRRAGWPRRCARPRRDRRARLQEGDRRRRRRVGVLGARPQPAVAVFVNGWRVEFIPFPELSAPIDYALAH